MKKSILVLCSSIAIACLPSVLFAGNQPTAKQETMILSDSDANRVEKPTPIKTKMSKRKWCEQNPGQCQKSNYKKGKVVEGDVWCKKHPRKCQERKEYMEMMQDHH